MKTREQGSALQIIYSPDFAVDMCMVVARVVQET